MAEKDMTSKTLESYNDVFADIMNVFLFDGRQVVSPQSLESVETTSRYKAEGIISEQERDVLKKWHNAGVVIAFVGAENQTKPYKFMPMRLAGYDGSMYRFQLKAGSPGENGLYYPVITIVLYFGSEEWNYPKNLLGCLNVPEELKPFVNDYKMNLYSIKDLSDVQIEKFSSDFRVIAEFFKSLYTESLYHPSDRSLDHPEETIDMISAFSGDSRYRNEYNSNILNNREGDVNMRNLYDEIMNMGIEKGRAEGEAKGKAEGKAEGEAVGIAKMLKQLQKLGNTVKQLSETFNMPESQIESYLAMNV